MENEGDLLEAEQLSTKLIVLLKDKDICPDIAMAALGDAFVRMMHGLHMHPDVVEDILVKLSIIYREDHEDSYGQANKQG